MKFCICGCLFDYYAYITSTKSTFLLACDLYKDIRYTFTLCTIDCFIHICYTCVFTMIKVKRFNEDLLNETLRSNCKIWQTDSHISRVQGTARTCFQNLKFSFMVNDFNANYEMSVCCFDGLKQFICNFLYDDFYTLDFVDGICS